MQGDHIDGSLIEKPARSTSLIWHPTAKSLIVGWEDGISNNLLLSNDRRSTKYLDSNR